MNKYELALVVSANVEDEVRNATVEQVKELITRFGGTITDSGTCEKKKLAYEIQHMSEGYYNFIKFEADATTPAEVESRIRIMENVIRFLIVKDGE
uniref:30S ribosomal protein S6 n=1 Tax=Lachnospira sp. TaxID=2049031 RepID=UPI0040260CBB